VQVRTMVCSRDMPATASEHSLRQHTQPLTWTPLESATSSPPTAQHAIDSSPWQLCLCNTIVPAVGAEGQSTLVACRRAVSQERGSKHQGCGQWTRG
jgi:hypothetical protein